MGSAGWPSVSAGISAHDFRIPQAVPARDIEQLFLIAETNAAIGSDHSGAIRGKLIDRRALIAALARYSANTVKGLFIYLTAYPRRRNSCQEFAAAADRWQ